MKLYPLEYYINSFLSFLRYEKRASQHTVEAYETDLLQLSNFLMELFEVKFPTNINRNLLRSWLVELVENGYEAKSIGRKVSALKSFFAFLEKRNVISVNPTLDIQIPKQKKILPTFIENDKLERLLDKVNFPDTFKGKRDHLLLEFLYSTGIRRSELIGLKLKDIDFDGRSIAIYGKGQKMRILPISQYLLKLTADYLTERNSSFPELVNEDTLFLTNSGKATYPKFIYRVVTKYLATVTKSKKRSPHVLRHSFATNLLNKGANLNSIKDLLGHASLSSTQIYTHNSIHELKNIYKKAHPKGQSENL